MSCKTNEHGMTHQEQIEDLDEQLRYTLARCHEATQTVIAELGSVGPENVEDAATRAVAEIRRLRALVEELEHGIDVALIKQRCGDNSCMFGRSGGMGTNGGCRDDHERDLREFRRKLRSFVMDIRSLMAKP